MQSKKLRIMKESEGYYYSNPADNLDESAPLLLTWELFEDLPEMLLVEFFKDAVIGDQMSGNDCCAIKKIGATQALITKYIYTTGKVHEYELAIELLLKLLAEYQKLEEQGVDEIIFKQICEQITLEGISYYKKSSL